MNINKLLTLSIPKLLITNDLKYDRFYVELTLINKNGSVKKLTNEGLTYKDISEITTFCIDNEMLAFSDDDLVITEIGMTRYKELEEKYKNINKDDWIEKELKSKIPRLKKNDIFLPNQYELFFD